jgi:hypothetical protein
MHVHVSAILARPYFFFLSCSLYVHVMHLNGLLLCIASLHRTLSLSLLLFFSFFPSNHRSKQSSLSFLLAALHRYNQASPPSLAEPSEASRPSEAFSSPSPADIAAGLHPSKLLKRCTLPLPTRTSRQQKLQQALPRVHNSLFNHIN